MLVKSASPKSEEGIRNMEARLEGLTARIRKLKAQSISSNILRVELSGIEREVEGIKRLIDVVRNDKFFKVDMVVKLSEERVLEFAKNNNVLISSSSESGLISKKTAFIAEGSFENLKKFQEAIVECEKFNILS